ASGYLDDDDRRVDVVAVGWIFEGDAGAERRREIEGGERGHDLVAIGLTGLLERRDERHHAVVAVGRERGRLLLREPRVVLVEESLQQCGRAVEILREPGVVALDDALGAVPVDRILERAVAGDQRLRETRLADLRRHLDAVT